MNKSGSKKGSKSWHQNLLIYSLVAIIIASVLPLSSATKTGSLYTIGIDKIIHFLAFLFVTILALVAYFPLSLWKIARVIVYVVLFGVTIEIIQLVIPYRTFNPLDIVANLFGVLFGALMWLVIKGTSLFNKDQLRHIQ